VAIDSVSVRVGTDVQSIDEVASSIDRFGARYAERLFSAAEIGDCGGIAPTAAPGLAARFAAKEAVIKLLAPNEDVPQWRSIEVVRQPGGACTIQLSGTAAVLADLRGVRQIEISMSHGAGVATATAVALAATTGPQHDG
jgi:holo-[acyl-carrier protein] synthase